MEEGREWVAQRQGMMHATPHSTRTASVMAAQWRVVRITSRSDSQAVSEDRRGGDFPFDPGAHGVSGHLMLRSGEQVRCRGSRGSLERGGDSLEGLETLESGGNSLEGGAVPPSGAGGSEAVIRSRAAEDDCLMGYGSCWAATDRGPFSYSGRGWFTCYSGLCPFLGGVVSPIVRGGPFSCP
jgi:hypothetical protein